MRAYNRPSPCKNAHRLSSPHARLDVLRKRVGVLALAGAVWIAAPSAAEAMRPPVPPVSGKQTTARTDDPPVLSDGCGHRLVLHADPFSMELTDEAGMVLSSMDPGGIRVGSVPAIDPDYNYDPWYFYQRLFPRAADGPPGLRWLQVERIDHWSLEGEGVRLYLRLNDGASAEMTVKPSCPTAYRFEFAAQDTPTAYVGLDFAAPAQERYYGLGEYFDSVEHRGRIRAMQFELDLRNLDDFYNEAHVPVPFLISTRGWGLFVEDMHPGIFDVAATQVNKVRVEFGTRGVRFYWMAASHPLDLVETYTGLTGAPAIPPVWAFAPIFWRDEVSGQEMVLEDAAAIREYGITGSGMWLDRPYETYITSMDFDPARFPDPESMVQTLHDTGFRLAGWNVPYLDPEDPAYPLFESEGWFVKALAEHNKFGPMIDFTHPEAMAYWQDRVREAIARGFEGWKMDYGEDVIHGVAHRALHADFYNGEDADTMHHWYSSFYHQAYFEPYQPEDVFIISRGGVYGGQTLTSVIWPGDLDTDFSYMYENGQVGGLPAAMIAGLSLSASGYPFYASDTGGYRTPRPTSEQLLRWTQYSAFLPIMQYGGCGDDDISCNPWDFSDQGERTYTEQTLEIFATYARLHTRLFPFFYSLAEKARMHGTPPVAPYGLYWPDTGTHPDDEMVVGDALLVAPLVRGGESRTLYLPEGRFVDFWTGAEWQGPMETTVQMPLDRVPLFFLDGAIVPMLRPGVQTLAPVADPSIDSFDDDAGRVWGYVVPADSATSFDLPFRGGTLWAIRLDAQQVQFGFTPSSTGTRFRGVAMQVYAPGTTRVTLEGQGTLPQASPEETATCAACFASAPDTPWVWIGIDHLDGWTVTLE